VAMRRPLGGGAGGAHVDCFSPSWTFGGLMVVSTGRDAPALDPGPGSGVVVTQR
jgi:hypothetical protein